MEVYSWEHHLFLWAIYTMAMLVITRGYSEKTWKNPQILRVIFGHIHSNQLPHSPGQRLGEAAILAGQRRLWMLGGWQNHSKLLANSSWIERLGMINTKNGWFFILKNCPCVVSIAMAFMGSPYRMWRRKIVAWTQEWCEDIRLTGGSPVCICVCIYIYICIWHIQSYIIYIYMYIIQYII